MVFTAEPVRDFRGFLDIDDSYSHAHWLFQHNGGVFLPPWGKIEQWLISVQHDEADIDRFVDELRHVRGGPAVGRVATGPGRAGGSRPAAAQQRLSRGSARAHDRSVTSKPLQTPPRRTII